jgi:hypothetical protein
VGLERGPISLVRIIEELLEWSSTYFKIKLQRHPTLLKSENVNVNCVLLTFKIKTIFLKESFYLKEHFCAYTSIRCYASIHSLWKF